MADSSKTSEHCTHCGEAASKHCSTCMNAKYCSKECQVADWSMHKLICKSFAAFKTPPTPQHRRAIIVREHASKPEFLWIRTDTYEAREGDGDGSDDESDEEDDDLGVPDFDPPREPRVDPLFDDIFAHDGVNKPLVQQLDLVVGRRGGGELLDHSILGWVRECFMLDGSDSNACLYRLSGGEVGSHWRGPVLFVGMSKVVMSSSCRNLDTSDLTLAINGMVEYSKKLDDPFGEVGSHMQPKQMKKVNGVKVDTKYTEGQGVVTSFQDVAVPVKHPAFTSGIPSKLCLLLGFPLVTFGSIEKATSGAGPTGRSPVGYLQLDIGNNPGPIPEEWQGTTETVLVVATDKQPIYKDEVEAVCMHIKKFEMPVLEGYLPTSAARDIVLAPEWKAFCAEYIKNASSRPKSVAEQMEKISI